MSLAARLTRAALSVGGVDAFTGEYETPTATGQEAEDVWRFVESEYTMPEKYETIRFELNAL